MLSALLLIFRALRAVGGGIELLEKRFARFADEVERSRLDQRFERLFVASTEVDLFAELKQRREASDAPSCFENGFDSLRADAFDGAEAEANVRSDNGEAHVRFIHGG